MGEQGSSALGERRDDVEARDSAGRGEREARQPSPACLCPKAFVVFCLLLWT